MRGTKKIEHIYGQIKREKYDKFHEIKRVANLMGQKYGFHN